MNGRASAVNSANRRRGAFARGDQRLRSTRGFGARSDLATEFAAGEETHVGDGTSAETSRCETSGFKDQPT
jgi:hypothetical protein